MRKAREMLKHQVKTIRLKVSNILAHSSLRATSSRAVGQEEKRVEVNQTAMNKKTKLGIAVMMTQTKAKLKKNSISSFRNAIVTSKSPLNRNLRKNKNREWAMSQPRKIKKMASASYFDLVNLFLVYSHLKDISINGVTTIKTE